MELNIWPDFVFVYSGTRGFRRPALLVDGNGGSEPDFPWHVVGAGFASQFKSRNRVMDSCQRGR
jgi:hypothetical protein